MSPHTVNNFVSDLVLMAQAVERVPQLEAELAQWQGMAGVRTDKIIALEADLEQSRTYAAGLEAKLHEAEVAKDAAETMFLEADERTSRALDFIKATFGNAGSLIQALEPPKVEPVVDHKLADVISGYPYGEGQPLPDTNDRADIDRAEAQGQSEPDPTYAGTEGLSQSVGSMTETTAVPSTSTSWATPTPQPDTPPAPAAQPYADKVYRDFAQYIPFDTWVAGGGTYDAYYH